MRDEARYIMAVEPSRWKQTAGPSLGRRGLTSPSPPPRRPFPFQPNVISRSARPRGQGHLTLTAMSALIVAFALLVAASLRARDPRELVVWTAFKDSEIPVLRRAADAFAATEGVPVRIIRVPFQELQPKIQVSVPVGQGPDLVTGPHDWIGSFVQADMVAPVEIPDAALTPYLRVALQAMRYRGALYGLPFSVSTLGLVVNRALVSDPPDTFSELIDDAKELTHDGRYGLLFDDTDFFFAYPFFGGYGACIFQPGTDGPDPLRLGLDTPEAIQAAQLLRDLHHTHGLIPVGTRKESASSLFREGRCAMTITGPWALQDYRDKHIDYQFMPIPPLDNGRWPQPLVSVDGVMLTRSSRHPAMATRLMLALTDKESEVTLNLSAGRIPARLDAQQDARVAANPDVPAIGASVEKGIPMPAIPAIAQVWGPMSDALTLITSGQAVPEDQLRATTRQISENIRKSME